MKTVHGFHPAGMLRISNFVPDKIVKSTHSHQSVLLSAYDPYRTFSTKPDIHTRLIFKTGIVCLTGGVHIQRGRLP